MAAHSLSGTGAMRDEGKLWSRINSVFEDHLAGLPGFRLEAGFIPLASFGFRAFECRRRVKSFGWRCDYSDRKLQQASSKT